MTCVAVVASFIALSNVGVVGIYSIMTASLVILVAFGASLIVVHFVVAPSAAVAGRTLVVGMMIKVVALATIVIWLQTPRWVNHDWYLWGIVVAAAAWVAAEVLVFVHQRNAVRAHLAGAAEGA